VTVIRHHFAPPPNGCRWCGYTKLAHGQQYTSGRWHRWTAPTDAQRKARLLTHIAHREAVAAA